MKEKVEQLFLDLDKTFEKSRFSDLPFLATLVEDGLQSLICEEVKSLILSTIPEARADGDYFFLNGVQMHIELVRDFRIRGCRGLVLKIERVEGTAPESVESRPFALKEAGEIRQLQVVSDADLECLHESIGSIFEEVYAAGYRYLSSRLLDLATSCSHRATSRLYHQIRSRLPLEVQKDVWLFAVEDKIGFYLLDPIAGQSAISRLTVGASENAESPLLAFARFATHMPNSDRDTFLSLGVVKESATVDATFNDVIYNPEVKIAQQALYNSANFTVQWLVREGRFGLTACYPSERRSIVYSILAGQRDRLKSILYSEYKQVARLRKMLVRAKILQIDGVFIGEVLYGIGKSALDSIR